MYDSYGDRGRTIISRLTHLIITTYEDSSPVKRDDYSNFDLFVEEIVVPEVTAIVISNDYKCSAEDGLHLTWLSVYFGLLEYPHTNSCRILQRVQTASSISELEEWIESEEVTPSAPVVSSKQSKLVTRHLISLSLTHPFLTRKRPRARVESQDYDYERMTRSSGLQPPLRNGLQRL